MMRTGRVGYVCAGLGAGTCASADQLNTHSSAPAATCGIRRAALNGCCVMRDFPLNILQCCNKYFLAPLETCPII